MKRDAMRFDPLATLAGKQRLGQEDADETALVVLIALDAAKRGVAPPALANTLIEHLAASAGVWSQLGMKKYYDAVVNAWPQLLKACARDTVLLDLTTGEYQAIRWAISHYLRALPQLEVGVLSAAHASAIEQLQGNPWGK